MNDSSDPWCKPIVAQTGNVVSGGAARNVRIAELGGMGKIVATAYAQGAMYALTLANQVRPVLASREN
jgi:hypothetical protein